MAVRFRSPAHVLLHQLHSGIEQLAARLAHNQKAPGSSPGPATKKHPVWVFYFLTIRLMFVCMRSFADFLILYYIKEAKFG